MQLSDKPRIVYASLSKMVQIQIDKVPMNVKLAGYSILDIGHLNVQCPISNIQLIARF